MKKALKISKLRPISLSLLLFAVCSNHIIFSADLDDLYTPVIERGKLFYAADVYYFEMEEDGIHGSASYDRFDSSPELYSVYNSLTFSPVSLFELQLGFRGFLPTSYKRSTYNPSGVLISLQENDLDHFYDYSLGLRLREEPIEIYGSFLQRRQKASNNGAVPPASPIAFNYIRTYYDQFKVGVRYLSSSSGSGQQTNLSKLKGPLLDQQQINIEAELQYRRGKSRKTYPYYYLGNTYYYRFFHNLEPHFTPGVRLSYGLADNLELESGLLYTTPLKYKYQYYYNYGGTSSSVIGTYRLKNSFFVPLKLNYRPQDNLEIMFSSDSNFINQKLSYWKKDIDGSITSYPSRRLTYYNTKPTVRITYLYNNDKPAKTDKFSSLTKRLLPRNQWLLDFQYQRDITHLRKDVDNGAQNIIDPYNLFSYPVDYFFAGTEYATFFTGNATSYTTNISCQNYYILSAGFIYGLTDSLNAGIRLGYRSANSLHHFTLQERENRFYKFKPSYFVDFLADWRIAKNSLISCKVHFVPDYKTFMDHEGLSYPQQFKSDNRYFDVSVGLRVLF